MKEASKQGVSFFSFYQNNGGILMNDKLFSVGKLISENGDSTSTYELIINKPCTVNEFVNYILSNKEDEWGYIIIVSESKERIVYDYVKYRYGLLMTIIPEHIRNKEIDISQVHTISGGWSSNDYILRIKEE